MAPARLEMPFGYWDKAAKRLAAILNSDSAYGTNAMAYKEALHLFALGMAALQKNQSN